jgi:virginiamycin B lyase
MAARSLIAFCFACLIAGCGFGSGTGVPSAGVATAPGSLLSDVEQKGKGALWVAFKPKTTSDVYTPIVLGPDKNVWFVDELAHGLVRIDEDGSVKEFSLSSALTGNGVSMAVGADKKFYILDESSNVIRVTDKGVAQSVPIPSGDTTSIDGLALGPDKNVWFAEFDHIGKITTAGKITELPYPSGYSSNQYGGVTTGSDGNVWFAESTGNAIGRVVPSSGKITMFPISVSCTPAPVVLANDGNVWFACLTSSPTMGRITPSGKITTFDIGGTFSFNETEQFCARGPDGDPWCASRNDANIFHVDSKTQKVTTFTPPIGSAVTPDALSAGADGNVWVDTVGGEIVVLVSNPMQVSPNKLDFSAPSEMKTLTVSENGTSSWTAKSSKTTVATVAAGKSASTFTVTSVGTGSCKITISDAVGNSVVVKVTVQ